MKTVHRTLLIPLAATSLFCMQSAFAQLPTYDNTYPTPNAACATYGNLVSCSTGVLDYLANNPSLYPGFLPPTNPYSFNTASGALHTSIVVTSNGGQTVENSDQIAPSEDGFAIAGTGTKSYFYTGDTDNKATVIDPDNNGTLLAGADSTKSWDVGLAALNDALTFDGAYHQMLIGFDFSEPQNGLTPNLPIWASITIRDVDGSRADVVVETQQLDLNNIFKDPSLFSSTKNFATGTLSQLKSTDFAVTVGAICVTSATTSYPSPNGVDCPDGGVPVGTNRGSSALEFINYFPSLNLQTLEAQGYDTLSGQVWMGCFGVTSNPKSGPALSDGIPVTQCDSGGYGDIFLLAGNSINKTPEPGTLALLGAALLGLVGLGRNKKAAIAA